MKIGAVNLSLIDACREDVAESVKLSAALRSYGSGVYKGGQGPSSADFQKRRYSEQNKRAEAYIAELEKVVEGEAVETRETSSFVESTSSHRHDPSTKQRQQKKTLRSAPYRSQRSQSLIRSLDSKEKRSFTVQHKVITADKIQVKLRQLLARFTICQSLSTQTVQTAHTAHDRICAHTLCGSIYLYASNQKQVLFCSNEHLCKRRLMRLLLMLGKCQPPMLLQQSLQPPMTPQPRRPGM